MEQQGRREERGKGAAMRCAVVVCHGLQLHIVRRARARVGVGVRVAGDTYVSPHGTYMFVCMCICIWMPNERSHRHPKVHSNVLSSLDCLPAMQLPALVPFSVPVPLSYCSISLGRPEHQSAWRCTFWAMTTKHFIVVNRLFHTHAHTNTVTDMCVGAWSTRVMPCNRQKVNRSMLKYL